MKNGEKLEAISKEIQSSKSSIEWENLSMFVNFMNQRFYRRMLEYCPTLDELIIKISYDKKGSPIVELGDAIILKGHEMMPFPEDFVFTMANFIQNQLSKEEAKELSIEVVMPGDREGDDDLRDPYEFWCYTPSNPRFN